MTFKQTLFLVLVLSLSLAWGQQTPSFTEYNYNPYLINPAFAGVLTNSEVTISNIGFGNQSIDGSPRSLAATFNSPLRNENMGIGVGFLNDEIGVTSATQIFGTYSYKVFLNDNAHPYWKIYDRSFLSFGLNAGALVYNQDLLSLGLQNDPNFAENINATLPMVGAGVLFGHGNFFSGVSIPNLLGESFANQDNLELSQPVYGYTGYHIVFDRYNPNFILKPSMLFKYEQGAPVQIDANLALTFKNIIELGGGFRTSNSLNLFLGFYAFENFRLLYSYTQGNVNSPFGNTSGIILSYRSGSGYSTN